MQGRNPARFNGGYGVPRGLGGLKPCARCAGKSMAEIGNRKERLRDYASFPEDFDLPRSKVATGLLHFAWDAPPR